MAPVLKSYNSKRRRPSSTMHPDSMLHLELKGIDLQNVASGRLVNRVSSPVFCVSSWDGEVVATSHRMPHTLNPCWPLITIPCIDLCYCDLDQTIKIEVHDQDDQGEKIASMGWVSTSVRSILKRQAGRFPLLRDDNTPVGKIEIVIAMIEIVSRASQSIVLENVPQLPAVDDFSGNKQDTKQDSFDEARLRLVLQGVDLAPVPIPGKTRGEQRKPNRFFRITRFQPGCVKAFQEAYTSDVVPESDCPLWEEAMISLADLCDENRHQHILISVWEEPARGRGMLDMGSCETTVAELLRTRAQAPKTLMLLKARKKMGTLLVKEAHIVGHRANPAQWIGRNTVSLVSALGQFRSRASQRAQHELGASCDEKTKKDEGSFASTIPDLSVSIDTSSSVPSESTGCDTVSSSQSEDSISVSSLIDNSDSSSNGSSARSSRNHKAGIPTEISAKETQKILLSEESMKAHELYVESLPSRYHPTRVESILQNMPKWDLDGDSVVGGKSQHSFDARYSIYRDHESHHNRTPSSNLGRKVAHQARTMAAVIEAQPQNDRSHSAPNISSRCVPHKSPRALASNGIPSRAVSRKQASAGRYHKYTNSVGSPKRTRSRFSAARGEPIHWTSEACRNLNRTLYQFTEIAHEERQRYPCHRLEDDGIIAPSTYGDRDTLTLSNSKVDGRRPRKGPGVRHQGNSSRRVPRSRLASRNNKVQKMVDKKQRGKRKLKRQNQGGKSNYTRRNTKKQALMGKRLRSIQKVVLQTFLRLSTNREWGPSSKRLTGRSGTL